MASALEDFAIEAEDRTRLVQESHVGSGKPTCMGYHPAMHSGRRSAYATFAVLLKDGGLALWCAKCVYGLDRLDVAEKRRLRA